MPRLDDIYYKVDSEIVANDWHEADNEEKKILLDNALKKFMCEKITEFDSTKSLKAEDQANITVNELAEILGKVIPEEDHFETMRHLTHYVLAVAGGIQGWSIVWEVDNSEEFLDNPHATFNAEGKWDTLTTHDQTSYIKTFEFVRDTMNQMILGKTKQAPQLTKEKQQLPKSDN